MKTGIIGLPQVGKTSLFKILTKAKLEERGYSNPREAHIGVARVPDQRLEKLEIYEEELVIIAGRDQSRIRKISDSRQQAILAFEHGCPHRKRLEDWLARAGLFDAAGRVRPEALPARLRALLPG